MAKTKVLVAEDTPEILELITDKLTFEGFEVITARDGEEAWDKIQKEDPDVILLDLMMPRWDGFTVLKMLREQPPRDKWQPVMIVSALSDLQTMRRSFSLEAEHYIIKPFHPNDIVQGIRKILKLVPLHQDHQPSQGKGESEKKDSWTR